MIVAAGAADGEAEEDAAGGIDHVDTLFDQVDVFDLEEHVAVGADSVKAGAGAGFGVVGVEFVAGDLLPDEAVVRFVFVERLDDVVAVAPGDEEVGVLFETGGIAVAGEVEPVASPFFAVARGGEQAVDFVLPGVGGFVVEEEIGFGLGGGQAEKVVGGAPQEGEAVGGGRFGDAGGGEFAVDEGVDGIAGGGVGRDGGANGFAEGPPGVGGVCGDGSGGPCCARVDPGFDGGDLVGGKGTAGRHGDIANMSDGFIEEAVGGVAGDEGGPAAAAFEEVVAGIDFEAGHAAGRAVTLGALLLEDGRGVGFSGGEGRSVRQEHGENGFVEGPYHLFTGGSDAFILRQVHADGTPRGLARPAAVSRRIRSPSQFAAAPGRSGPARSLVSSPRIRRSSICCGSN